MKYAIHSMLLLTVMSHCALAEVPGKQIDSALQQCKLNAETTIDTQKCYGAATAAWDAELGVQYKLLLKDQPDNVRIALWNSQRQWIKYRDEYNKGIEAFYQKEQGTIWSLVAAESKMNVIRDKALDLNRLSNSTDLGG
ncbi:lysozyme inhibitor LprI family protein [Phytobacter sp. V91]|uniref:lysozyme inhibitor LprI family protein n=1 Tax=Phytobacter sp. V91 TaxID=3369425 RepID=UPI003F5F1656